MEDVATLHRPKRKCTESTADVLLKETTLSYIDCVNCSVHHLFSVHRCYTLVHLIFVLVGSISLYFYSVKEK
jgi:hypothetical protein